MTLTKFSRSRRHFLRREILFPDFIFWTSEQVLMKLAQIHCWEDGKSCLYYLWPWLFKVTATFCNVWNFVSGCYLLNQWTDFDQTCIDTMLGGCKGLIRYWWPWLNFQGHSDLFFYGVKFHFRTLSSETVNRFDETCRDTLLVGWEELFIFWWPWPNFQGQQPLKAVKWAFLSLYLCDARKQTLRFPNSGDKNWAVQSQKRARPLKFQI